eukprot:352836-Chlamydomonas_euryale.AAC.3
MLSATTPTATATTERDFLARSNCAASREPGGGRSERGGAASPPDQVGVARSSVACPRGCRIGEGTGALAIPHASCPTRACAPRPSGPAATRRSRCWGDLAPCQAAQCAKVEHGDDRAVAGTTTVATASLRRFPLRAAAASATASRLPGRGGASRHIAGGHVAHNPYPFGGELRERRETTRGSDTYARCNGASEHQT